MQLTLSGTVETVPYDAAALKEAIICPHIAVDIETETRWQGIGPEIEFGLSYVAPVTTVAIAYRQGAEIKTVVLCAPFDELALDAINFIMRRSAPIVCHNSVFDMRGISKLSGGAVPSFIWDTMIMARLIHPELMGKYYDLLSTAKALGIEYPAYMTEMKKKRKSLHTLSASEIAKYGGDDAALTLRIYERQLELVQDEELNDLVDWDCRAMRVYCKMTARGVRINRPYVEQRVAELDKTCRAAAQVLREDGLTTPNSPKMRARYIYAIKRIPIPEWRPLSEFYTDKAHSFIKPHYDAGAPINVRITFEYDSHLAKVFEVLELPAPANTYQPLAEAQEKKILVAEQQIAGKDEDAEPVTIELDIAQLSTSTEVLNIYCGDHDSPFYEQLSKLSNYLAADRMRSTLSSLLEHSALDGRAHSLVAPTTQTGRRASGHPAQQNWKMISRPGDPAGDMAGVAIGDDDESLLIEIDYNGAENNMSALAGADHNFAAAIASGDFHTEMAKIYFPKVWNALEDRLKHCAEDSEEYKAIKKELKHWRDEGKKITFGTAYGMGAALLSVSIGCTVDEAREILRNKDAAMPWVARTKREATQKAKERGFVYLWTGRKVMCGSYESYKAWNYICQGGVGEMVKRSIVLIDEELERRHLRSRIALDMHDAIILSVHNREVDEVLSLASSIMESVMPPEFNERTNPPIRWIAQPKLEENKLKWGKLQNPVEYTPIDISADVAHEAAAAMGQIDPYTGQGLSEAQTEQYYVIEDIELRLPLKFRIGVRLAELSRDEVIAALDLYDEVYKAIDNALKRPYTTRLPLTAKNELHTGEAQLGDVQVSEEVQVDIDNWSLVPLVWARCAHCNAIIDEWPKSVSEVFGTVDELAAEHEGRKHWVASLRERMQTAAAEYERIVNHISIKGIH
jgi:DNA polymerase I-like protein with 3'-5' exonuclease and polymerase domains